MLSYQHIYHAGCLADVQKHAALAVVLEQLVQKDKPLYYMETHAGRGLYDLSSVESTKTGEANAGIIALRNKLPANHPYTKILNSLPKNIYPGSPTIAHKILRRDDRMFLMELHPQEFRILKDNMGNYSNVFTHNEDGYAQTLALSPPIVRRGLVLIDPSYEIKDEYGQTAEFVRKLHKKWPETVIMLWYPILKSGAHDVMVDTIKTYNLPKFWQQEIIFSKTANTLGSGLIMCNLPYGSEAGLEAIRIFFR